MFHYSIEPVTRLAGAVSPHAAVNCYTSPARDTLYREITQYMSIIGALSKYCDCAHHVHFKTNVLFKMFQHKISSAHECTFFCTWCAFLLWKSEGGTPNACKLSPFLGTLFLNHNHLAQGLIISLQKNNNFHHTTNQKKCVSKGT